MLGLTPPLENYWELLQTTAIYAARLWTLYGPECDLYKKLLHIQQVFKNLVVETNKNHFTPTLVMSPTYVQDN